MLPSCVRVSTWSVSFPHLHNVPWFEGTAIYLARSFDNGLLDCYHSFLLLHVVLVTLNCHNEIP